jgi:nicotinic acid mononucleotide adenylyltransferase
VEQDLPAPLAAHWRLRGTEERRRLESTPAGAIYRQAITPQPIASTAIRQALVRGADGVAQVRGLLPAAVLAYIDRHQLYRPR